MKHNFIFSFFLFFAFQLSAQENFHAGINVSSGYSIIKPLENELFILQPEVNSTIPIELGAFFTFRPVSKIQIGAKANLEYNHYALSYNDIKTYQEKISTSSPSERLIFLNSYRLNDEYPVFSIKVPVSLKFFLIKHLYVFGGVGINLYLTDVLRNKWESISHLGIGADYKKIGWELYIEAPLKNNSFFISDDYLAKRSPGIGVEYLQRSIKFSLTYNLWSK
ncbi:MAG: hypothetical protein JW798_07135 [Prolixibacteraceae bacterium]|nr:hypothetical protein [Prolixibacteraceae bacterium]